jgi:uncharacterized protein YqjF (DUF2071 family)
MAATYSEPVCFPSNLNMQKVFLTAEWRKLIMVNYAIDPKVLSPYLPAGAELDFRDGTCYISLVAFMFTNTKVKGIAVPFHTDFEEVNLRFYVRFQKDGEWKRGTVFIKELVPKYMIALIANQVYREHYATCRMQHKHEVRDGANFIRYTWDNGRRNYLEVVADQRAIEMDPGSKAEFIAEHYYGLSKVSSSQSNVYEVQHPRWQMYPVLHWDADVDFGLNYGERFGFLTLEKPDTVFLMEGSPVQVMDRQRLMV